MPPVPVFTLPEIILAVTACAVTALVAAIVLHRPRRWPAPVAVFVIVFLFVIVLVAVRVDPLIIATLISAAGVVAIRLSPSRSRQG